MKLLIDELNVYDCKSESIYIPQPFKYFTLRVEILEVKVFHEHAKPIKFPQPVKYSVSALLEAFDPIRVEVPSANINEMPN